MPLVIRDADETVYARFKAKAAFKGLKIGEAITEAMKKWVEEEIPSDSNEAKQESNNIAYRRMIPDLRNNYLGKWGVVSKGDLLGIFDNKKAALEAIQSHESVPSLLFPISEKKERRIVRLGIRRLTNERNPV